MPRLGNVFENLKQCTASDNIGSTDQKLDVWSERKLDFAGNEPIIIPEV